MRFFSSLLFGVSASLDSLLVGVSFGIRRVHIRLWQNLFISLVTLLGTCLSISMGHLLIPLLPEAVCNRAGSLILILLGLYYIAKWAASSLRGRRAAGLSELGEISSAGKKRETLSPAEVFTLSLTLSLNNLGIGLSASLAGLTLLSTATATLICSVFLLYLGNRLGRCRLLQLAGAAAEPVSGVLLIGLGFVQFIL